MRFFFFYTELLPEDIIVSFDELFIPPPHLDNHEHILFLLLCVQYQRIHGLSSVTKQCRIRCETLPRRVIHFQSARDFDSCAKETYLPFTSLLKVTFANWG